MGYSRQEWHAAMFSRAGEGEHGQTAAVSLSSFVGAILLVIGWHGGHVHNRILVGVGAALLILSLVLFAFFVFRRLRSSA
jgi:hypothetical protein